MKLKDIFNLQINEAPDAGRGNMDDDKFTPIDKKSVSKIEHYINRGNFTALNKKIYLYQIPNTFNYVFGFIENGVFNEYGSITLLPEENTAEHENVYTIDKVEVANDARGKGLSTKLYRFLVLGLHIVLMSGDIQFFGARRLWSNLSRQPDMAVDVVNTRTQEIIERNATLEHGPNNDDFSAPYWGVNRGDTNFHHIRFVLRPK
jgi:hypothetical protein